jgi:hypothetical protein
MGKKNRMSLLIVVLGDISQEKMLFATTKKKGEINR